MDAVRHRHQVSDPFRAGLLPCQVAGRLLVFRSAVVSRYPAAGLEVEGRTGAHQVVGGTVAEAEVLALLQDHEGRGRVADDVVVEALQLDVGQALVHQPAVYRVRAAGSLG